MTPDMKRHEVINACLSKCRGTSYLEIGCKADGTFRHVDAKRKVGVDIASGGTVRMSSDDYFAQCDETFDVIFIDGCHHHDFVMRDFDNALKVLRPDGMILMHDCNPITRDHEKFDGCGTAWRAFVHIRSREDVDAIVCDFDHGLSIVKVRTNTWKLSITKSMDELTYDDLERDRKTWLDPQPAVKILNWISG